MRAGSRELHLTRSPVAIATACWGSYWRRFGAAYVAAIEAMQPLPAEVVLVTRDAVEVPAWWRVVEPQSPLPMWDWFNESVAACTTEYVLPSAIDDCLLPDGLAEFECAGDVISVGCITDGQPEPLPTAEDWEHLLDVERSAIWTASAFRREVFLRYPWRRVAYSDWMQWLELRHAGADIRFDRKPRFIHARHEGANSYLPSPFSDRQIREMKTLLATGLVVPGPEWPPRGGEWRVATRPRGTHEVLAELRRRKAAIEK